MPTFDVWVIRFQAGGTVPPAEGLQRIFGIDAAAAAEVEQTVPRVVKHRVEAEAAEKMRRALESIGAVVECRPARPSRRGEDVGARPPEGISVPATAAVERAKLDQPALGMGAPSMTQASLTASNRSSLSGTSSAAIAQSARARSVSPMTHPMAAWEPEGVVSESVEISSAQPSSEPPEPALARLDGYLDELFGTRRRRYFAQAFAMIASAFLIVVLCMSAGNSVFRGEADAWGVGFAGVAFWLLGLAGHELYTLVRG